MDQAQIAEVLNQMYEASEADDMVTFVELAKRMPVSPKVALAFKLGFGADYVRDSGFNLSEADKAFVPGWLDE